MPMATIEMRQEAARRVAVALDHQVREESAYGNPGSVGFDETMAITAIAHTLSVWWGAATSQELDMRLQALMISTKTAWQSRQIDLRDTSSRQENSDDPTLVPPNHEG
jgi:hypothetical protein